MASEFVDNIVPAFVAPALFHPLRFRRLKARLMDILRNRCVKTYYRHPDDIPASLKDELRGTVAGCKARNPATPVTFRELFLLNTGIDFLLSYVYTGVHLLDWIPDLDVFLEKLRGRSRLVRRLTAAIRVPRVRARHLRVPLACNAFFLGSSLTEDGGCYFGRDFMFATAGVFQDTCCLIVHNPSEDAGGRGDRRDAGGALPIVSLTAPGLVGSITAMNSEGVAVGVDMLPAENCNFRRPGLNSLLLARCCADRARSLEDAVDAIVGAQRGVSWLYVVADGKNGRAAAVEAGMTAEALRGLSYVPQRYRPVLEKHPYRDAIRGVMVRSSGYRQPSDLAALNETLFAMSGKRHSAAQEAAGGRFHSRVREPWKQKAVPRSFYFPPQREHSRDLLVAANQALTPEMRLCSMGPWVSLVAAAREDDLQWRYDELTHQIRAALGPPGRPRRIGFEQARALIDFLSPLRKFPSYYAHNAATPRGRRIEGAVALCDLSRRVMHAYYGCYDETWMRLTLPRYCARR